MAINHLLHGMSEQVVLNKVDQLDNNVDFARAFGTLGVLATGDFKKRDVASSGRTYIWKNVHKGFKRLLKCGWDFCKCIYIYNIYL